MELNTERAISITVKGCQTGFVHWQLFIDNKGDIQQGQGPLQLVYNLTILVILVEF